MKYEEEGRAVTVEVRLKVPISHFTREFSARLLHGKTGRAKFENVRTKLFRSLKRAVNAVIAGQKLKGIARVPRQHSLELLGKFTQLCTAHKLEVTRFAAHSRRNSISYNNNYVSATLRDPILRALYELYIELIFEEQDLSLLCEHWKVDCCLGEHGNECTAKWSDFKEILLQQTDVYANKELIFRGPLSPALVTV